MRVIPRGLSSLICVYIDKIQGLEHFPCCWVSRKGRAAAFSLRKTPIDAETLHYTYRKNALKPTARLRIFSEAGH